jgi:FMN phosphatase YigB (HAD superfamily)
MAAGTTPRQRKISPEATVTADAVFLLDVDNTLLDNDHVVADLRRHLKREFGAASSDRYWEIFEALRGELGYADYLGALQRYRADVERGMQHDHQLLMMSEFLIDYPFAARLYPRAIETIDRLGRFGETVILSDGDVIFQPRKVRSSGLWDAVGGRVLIFVHKEQMLGAVQRLYPARHYVMVDDKLRILAAMKRTLRERLTTVFPRQGHYALDPANVAAYPPADLAVERIGDLADVDLEPLLEPPAGTANAIQEKR